MTALRFCPGLAAGVGLGAFVDGILFHQILQWHHFVSDEVSTTSLAGLETNTLWDGLFHVLAWTVCAAGIWMLWQAGRRGEMADRGVLLGAMLVGWGGFSFFDGVALHFVAGLHHLYERGGFAVGSDILYLVAAAVIVLVGLAVAGRSHEMEGAPASPSKLRA